jgi:hypothetical protein
LPDGIWEKIKAADEEAKQQAKQQEAEEAVAKRRSSLRAKNPTAKAVDTKPAKKAIAKKRRAAQSTQIQCVACGKRGQVGKACDCPSTLPGPRKGRAKKPPPGSPWETHEHEGRTYYWNRGELLKRQPRTSMY